MEILLTLSVLINILLFTYAVEVQRGSFGVLGSAAGRLCLQVLETFGVAVSIIAFDVRKVHELVKVLGYNQTTHLIHAFVKMRYGKLDFVFQWGGDEFVIFTLFPRKETAESIVRRMDENMRKVSTGMTVKQCDELRAMTGGLVDSLCVSMVWASYTRNAMSDATAMIDECNKQKNGGVVTAERATTGLKGMLINEWNPK